MHGLQLNNNAPDVQISVMMCLQKGNTKRRAYYRGALQTISNDRILFRRGSCWSNVF